MSQPRKIEFTGGFTIVPNGTTPPGPGDYYLVADYRPALNNGEITIPLHDIGSVGGLDFNDVNQNTGNAIYINGYDVNGNDNFGYLSDLIGKHTHITFSQGTYHITYDCTNQAWQNQSYLIYHDPTQGSAPQNSISIVSTSGVPFNDVDPITITIQVI
jgi:hypothetical protein